MDFFTFVATDIKVNKTTVRYSGVYMGTLPLKGDSVELLGIDNDSHMVKVTSVKDNVDSIPHSRGEQTAEMSVSLVSGVDPSEFDVLTVPVEESKEKTEEEKAEKLEKTDKVKLDNRRLESLIWKYLSDRDVNTLGAISQYLTFTGIFYIPAKPSKHEGKYNFPTVQNGRFRYYPIFTNMTEFSKRNILQDAVAAPVTFNDLVKILHRDVYGHGIKINPWTVDLTFNRQDLGKLKKMKEMLLAEADEEVEEDSSEE